MGYIYLRTNRINGKKYIGQVTTNRFKARQYRWNNLNLPYAGNVINNARKKYGIDAFDFEILKECKDEELNQLEMYYIKELNTKVPYGYNMTDGGGGKSGFTVSHETKQKISESLIGKKLSEEHKKKLSEAHRGKKHYMYGKHLSDKTRKKLSEAHKGKKLSVEHKIKISESLIGKKHPNYGKHHSEETRKKMSEAQKGKHRSEETRKKMSEAQKGEKHWNYGKHLSDEHKRKIGETNKNGKCSKPVLQIDIKTNEIIKEFPSIKEVERQLGFGENAIRHCCKGRTKTSCGFKWQYK